jgi:ABC-type multidrug transport system ATPase subunit
VDSATAQQLLDIFHDLSQAEGLTVIIVTHDPQIARRVDRVVAIRDGRTSTETIRRVSQLEQALVGERQPMDVADEIAFQEFVVIDSAGRLQVPREHLESFGISDRVTLEAVDEGILIRPVAGRELNARPLIGGVEEELPPQRSRGLQRLWRRNKGQ